MLLEWMYAVRYKIIRSYLWADSLWALNNNSLDNMVYQVHIVRCGNALNSASLVKAE